MEDGIVVKTLTPTMTNAATVMPSTGDGTRLGKQVGTPAPRAAPPVLCAPRTSEEGVSKCSVAAQTVNQGTVSGRPVSPPKFKPSVAIAAAAATGALLQFGGEGVATEEVSTTASTSHASSHMQVVCTVAAAVPGGGEPARPFASGEKGAPQSQPHTNRATPPTSGKLSPVSSEHSSVGHDDLSLFNKQVSKLKRFFTTLQEFANKISQEVAEQVQELITALVNGTVTVVEFHQEIQSVTNHPLKEFIIPFLKESLDPLRQHLKASSQDIADILDMVQTPGPSLGLTPQLIDTELPVLSSTKPPSFISTPNASSLSPLSASSITRLSSSPPPRPSNLAIFSTGNVDDSELSPNSSPPVTSFVTRKRSWNAACQDKGRGHGSDLDKDRGHSGDPDKASTKRPKPLVSADPECALTVTELATPHLISTLQQSQLLHTTAPTTVAASNSTTAGDVSSVTSGLTTAAVTPSVLPIINPAVMDARNPAQINNLSLPATMAVWLNEDWGHIDVMLCAIQQMLEKTHSAVNTLRERLSVVELALHQSRSEQERREELEKEMELRISEAVERVRHAAAEERQRLLTETSKHMIETVNTVRVEMEGRMAQAVEEALKQASTKEMCWNCGRRATETCSGCNKARYCGTFCQHKDWVKHMHDCSSGIQGMEVDREQETTDRPIVGHNNDVIQPDRRQDTSKSRGSISSDTVAQGEEKKAFTAMAHPTSMM